MSGLTNNPHDKVFKETFANLKVARSFFAGYLPAEIAAALDFDTLAQVPGSFIDEAFSERHTDLLFSVKAKKQSLNIYCLFEHQSKPDPFMPLRLLGYMLRIWEKYRKDHPKTKRLPIILPIVLHQGRSTWEASLHFNDLFGLSETTLSLFESWIPHFSALLVDLPSISFDQLRTNIAVDAIFLLFKAVREGKSTEYFAEIAERLYQTLNQTDLHLLQTLLTYFITQAPNLDKKSFFTQIEFIANPETKEHVMTLGQSLHNAGLREGMLKGRREGITKGRREGITKGIAKGRREGIAKGITKGRQEGQLILLRRLLTHRFGPIPESVDDKLQDAPLTQLEVWFTRTLDADSLEEVFKCK